MPSKRRYQRPKQNNPAVKKMEVENRIKEVMKDSFREGITYATLVYSIIMAMVLLDKTSLSDEEVKKVCDNIGNTADSIVKDYVSVEDLITTLREEYGFTPSEDKMIDFYPSLVAYLPNKEEE